MSPQSERANPMANHVSTNVSPPLKDSFGTVEPISPTPAVKQKATFIDGTYRKDSEPKTSELKRFVDRATNIYSYDTCPLPEGHLRLLFLKPSKDRSDLIIVQLQAFPIEKLVKDPKRYQFTALSYNWGGGKDDKEIFVDMSSDDESPVQMKGLDDLPTAWKRRMKPIWVKPNLHAFLKEFRHPTREVALWVDKVCINQANNEEKADQVSKMGIICSTAANVAIWLGTADDKGKSDRAMDFIGSMLKQDELALAKTAEVRCGSKRVHWRDFSDAVSIFELHFDIILKIIKRRPDLQKSLEGIKDMTPFGARILVDVLSNTFQRDANGTIFSPQQGLESFISSLSTFETSDPRHTIYTLLNLAKETFNLPSEDKIRKEKRLKRNEANPPPFPDYSKNLLDVYTNFMKWCIRESGWFTGYSMSSLGSPRSRHEAR
ncbi:hypothetical protein NW767_014605 [Fusarium falciforme]|nr:hypothetical protein NW767_014605 [Fusarium falciforme]